MSKATAADMPIDREFEFTQKDFEFLAALAYRSTGIVLQQHKSDMVYGRVARRLRALRLTSVGSYCALLDSPDGQEELGNLVNALTTNLTSFFREAHHFDHLATHVLKPFAAQSREPRLRIWSAGCSAGAEPYSIAMMLAEHVPEAKRRDALILATDIDTNMLATGAAGEYEASWIEKIPEPLQKKYALPSGNRDTLKMAPELQKLIRFKRLNLLESWPMQGMFDVIFCRNVVIYFDKP
ncbi:MAG: chemotaxis protein CheR, partial [Burkholderiales bacterium 12-64-5]